MCGPRCWHSIGVVIYRDNPIFGNREHATFAKTMHFHRLQPQGPEAIPWQGSEPLRISLHQVQDGDAPISAKALKGFGGRTVLELVDNFDGDTYRAVYPARFAEVVYVLHAFQKKSRNGVRTPQQDIDRIKMRLRDAEAHYSERIAAKGQKP
jgi:phage-related protein